jgi:hypothetical protein
MTTGVPSQPANGPERLQTEAYRITVDNAESFCALSIECPDNEDAWLISDTVRSLESMR